MPGSIPSSRWRLDWHAETTPCSKSMVSGRNGWRKSRQPSQEGASPGPRRRSEMLETIDLSKSLTREEYAHSLVQYQLQLRELAYQLYVQKRTLVMVYEGWDAAGKGGAIKRVTEKLDPRGYEVFSIAAPQGEDATHHYLWRFWRRLKPPDEKQVLIFDRSWYGRVMVERIEGFCSETEWKRAYREINEFERQLVDHGMIIAKFWLHISSDEQLRRFEMRQMTPYKSWKLTDEDWRNRQRWEQYEQAVEDMLLRTSTLTAPWTIIPGNDKWFARVKTLRTLVDLLGAELHYTPLTLPPMARKSGDTLKKDKRKEKKGEMDANEMEIKDVAEEVEEVAQEEVEEQKEKKEKKAKKEGKEKKQEKEKKEKKGKKEGKEKKEKKE
ncbi:MAG: hypothetical protein JXD18_09300, partial [Anaerolineae bacterium]|nr:hypothetical protein [Anaerolineae bacterium]